MEKLFFHTQDGRQIKIFTHLIENVNHLTHFMMIRKSKFFFCFVFYYLAKKNSDENMILAGLKMAAVVDDELHSNRFLLS
jgi:hypothetical protein